MYLPYENTSTPFDRAESDISNFLDLSDASRLSF